jgi:uncharacterized protein YoxC
MNPTLVLIFGVGVLVLCIALAAIGIAVLRELMEVRSVLESIEGELVNIAPAK